MRLPSDSDQLWSDHIMPDKMAVASSLTSEEQGCKD